MKITSKRGRKSPEIIHHDEDEPPDGMLIDEDNEEVFRKTIDGVDINFNEFGDDDDMDYYYVMPLPPW